MTVPEYEKYILKRDATTVERMIFYSSTLRELKDLIGREPTMKEEILHR